MYSNTADCSSSRDGQVRRLTSSFLRVAKNVSATAGNANMVFRLAAQAQRPFVRDDPVERVGGVVADVVGAVETRHRSTARPIADLPRTASRDDRDRASERCVWSAADRRWEPLHVDAGSPSPPSRCSDCPNPHGDQHRVAGELTLLISVLRLDR